MKEIILSNIIFPIWFLLFNPKYLLIALPIIFVIDSIALFISLLIFRKGDVLRTYKKVILKVFIVSAISYILGSLFLLAISFLPITSSWYENVISTIMYNPFENVFSFLFVAISVLIAAVSMHIFNIKISFKKTDMDEKTKKRIALLVSIIAAPYLFFYPTKIAYEGNNGIGSDNNVTQDVSKYIKQNKDTSIASDKAKTLFSDSIKYTDFEYEKVLNNVAEQVVPDEKEVVVTFSTTKELINNAEYYNSYLNSVKQTAAIMFSTCADLEIVSIVNSYKAEDGTTMTKDVLIRKDILEREYGVNFSEMSNDSTKLKEIINNTENVKIYE